MRGFVRFIKILLVVLIVLPVALVLALNFGLFTPYIETIVASESGVIVHFSSIRLGMEWPLTLRFGPTEVQKDGAVVNWAQMAIQVPKLKPPYDVSVDIDFLRMQLTREMFAENSGTPVDSSVPQAANTPGVKMAPIHLKLKITNAEIKSPFANIYELNLKFEQTRLLDSTASLFVNGKVKFPKLPLVLPFTFESDSIALSQAAIQTSATRMSISGLEAIVKGTSILKEDRHRWQAQISAPNLALLPKAPFDVPAKNWEGSVGASVEVYKAGPKSEWAGYGAVKMSKVSAVIDYEAANSVVKGPASLELDFKFQYANSKPVIPSLEGRLDLSKALITYDGILDKKADVPFHFKMDAKGDTTSLDIVNFEVALWTLVCKVTGQSQLQAPYKGKLEVAVPKASLAGLEKVFLPLSKLPVQGEVEVTARIEGELLNPLKNNILVRAATFKNFAANVNFNRPSFKIDGPVRGSFAANGQYDLGDIKFVRAAGDVEMKGTMLSLGPLRKQANQDLALKFNLQNEGALIDVTNFEMNSFFGRAVFSGLVKNLKSPKLDGAKVQFSQIKLDVLREAMLEYKDKIPRGTISGDLIVSGDPMVEVREWQDLPVRLEGSVQIHLPEYKLITLENPESTLPPGGEDVATPLAPTQKPPEPFLPKGAFTSQLNLRAKVDVDRFINDKLIIKDLRTDGTIKGGRYSGTVTIGEVLSGQMQIQPIEVPLFDKRAVLKGTAKWQGIGIQQGLAMAMPEHKNMASGTMSGQADFTSYMPSDLAFMDFLKAKGSIEAKPVTINTLKFGELVNSMIAKVPVVKLTPVKVTPLQGKMSMTFDLNSQNLLLQRLLAEDDEGSSLSLQGSANIKSMEGDLLGEFHWVNPQVTGCMLEGNADAKSRMLIPVAIKGNLKEPNFAMISDLVSKLGARALSCEQKKIVEQVKKDGVKKVGDEVKKQIDKFLGK